VFNFGQRFLGLTYSPGGPDFSSLEMRGGQPQARFGAVVSAKLTVKERCRAFYGFCCGDAIESDADDEQKVILY